MAKSVAQNQDDNRSNVCLEKKLHFREELHKNDTVIWFSFYCFIWSNFWEGFPLISSSGYYCTHWHEVTMQFRRPGWKFLYLSHADTHVLPQCSAGLGETVISWKRDLPVSAQEIFCPYISFIWLRGHLSIYDSAQINVFILLMFHKASSQLCTCFLYLVGKHWKHLDSADRFGTITVSLFTLTVHLYHE